MTWLKLTSDHENVNQNHSVTPIYSHSNGQIKSANYCDGSDIEQHELLMALEIGTTL